MARPRILVVEDDPVISMLNRNRLTKLGYEVTAVVSTGEEAINQAEKLRPDLALMDIKLEGPMDGIETARLLRTLLDVPVIYLTAYAEEALLERAKVAEPLGYLVKPYDERGLRSAIEMALYKNTMERRLRENERKFRGLTEAAPFAIAVMAPDTAFEYLNRKFTEIFGYTIKDIPDRNAWLAKACPDAESLHRETTPWGVERLDTHVSGETDPNTFAVTCKDGSKKIVSLRSVELDDGRHILAYQDVTAEMEAQEEIIRAKTQWELTFDAVSDCIMILDDQYRIIRMNRAMAKSLGPRQTEAVGKYCYEVVHGETIPHASCPLARVLEDGREHHTEVTEERLGGVFDVRVAPIHGKDGRVIGGVHTARDITEQKRAEEKLHQANELQRQLLATAATAIFTVDSERRVTGVNDEFCRITGFENKDILGNTCHALLGDQCAGTCPLSSPAASRGLTRLQATIKTKDGMILTVLKNATVMTNGKGQTVGGIESFVDVTELIQARRAAEQASRAKTDFLTNMSHELRTPLNAIIGFSELLLDHSAGKLNDEQASYVTDVLDAGRHLLVLINEILDLAKVEAGKMELDVARVRIAHVIGNCLMMIRETAIKHALTLELNIDSELEDLEIEADEVKFKQILFNLLSNAAKFTPDGGAISVAARKIRNEILVSVSDTGVGLRPEDHDRIFGMFEQADPSYARRGKGTGLGLTLTRKLVQLQGGRIWAESEGEGRGCTFHIVIPLIVSSREIDEPTTEEPLKTDSNDKAPSSQQTPAHGTAPAVLVVEDVDLNLQLTTALLKKAGYRVIQAKNAEDGIMLARIEMPDLILMDVGLPDMEGLTAVRILKQSPETANTPIVAVTARAMRGDEEECRAAGCAAYIPKPIDSRILRRVIRDLLARNDRE